MITITAKIRKISGKKVKNLKKEGIMPAVLYGSGAENLLLEIDLKEFEKIYKEAGESSLISLEIEKYKDEKIPVLIHEVQYHPLTDKPIHTDFYHPDLKKEIEAKVSLVFEGDSQAVKDLSGTLIKNISEVEVKAFPQNLPHEIKVNVESIKTFEDSILIKDLKIPEEVKILHKPEDVVANVIPPRKEEELEKPIEEEEVEKEEKSGEKKETEEEIEEEIKEKEKKNN